MTNRCKRSLFYVFGLLVFAGFGMAQDTKTPMAQDLEPLKGNTFEVRFLAYMIHHHQSGVQMARLSLEKAADEQVRRLSEKMIEDQEREIDQMTGWLQEWHGKKPEEIPAPEASQKKSREDLARLNELRGEEFDQQFLQLMSKHHSGAIEMGSLVAGRSQREPLLDLSEKIVEVQRNEIEKMHGLL